MRSPVDFEEIFAASLQQRRLLLWDPIFEENLGLWVTSALVRLNLEDPEKPIEIWIDSSGGRDQIARSLVGGILASEAPVVAIVTGRAFSSATIILLACCRRFAYESATFLLHFGNWGLRNVDLAELHTDPDGFVQVFQRDYLELVEFILKRTSLNAEKLFALMRQDRPFGAGEALELGLIEKILPGCGQSQGDCFQPQERRGA